MYNRNSLAAGWDSGNWSFPGDSAQTTLQAPALAAMQKHLSWPSSQKMYLPLLKGLENQVHW